MPASLGSEGTFLEPWRLGTFFFDLQGSLFLFGKAMPNTPEQQKIRREARIAQGLCSRCGKVPPLMSARLCLRCRDRHKDSSLERQKLARVKATKNNICKYCRNSPMIKGSTRCESCLNRHKERIRERRYGISPEEYNKLISEQQGFCACCKEKPTKRLVIEHNHDSKKVRGLVCDRCNQVLSFLDNEEARIQLAREYLERTN